MELDPADVQQHPAVAAFIAELRHWREVSGCSQKKLAGLVGYTPSCVSKVERCTLLASKVFAEAADQHLQAGRAIIRCWKEMHEALLEISEGRGSHAGMSEDSEPPPGPELVIEHEQAELVLRDVHARYRAEWKFRNPDEEKPPMQALSPAEQMRSLDIVRVGQVRSFAKGMGLAAPQIGIGRAAAVIRTPEGETMTLLNRQICGRLCRSRMRPGVEPIPVSVYQGIGQQWSYR